MFVCFSKNVPGLKEGWRVRVLGHNYVKTFSRERSPDLDTKRKRWNRRAGSIV
jgi:hypothetical protein